MKKTLITVLVLFTSCTYSPKDNHATIQYHRHHYSPKPEQHRNTQSNEAPFYDNGFRPMPQPMPQYRPQYRESVDVGQQYYQNPYYNPIPHPVNRSIYFIER